MGTAKALSIGSSATAPYVAFGDDSQLENVVAYAYVIVDRRRLKHVEARIAAMREWLRLPKDVLIHCRVLFNPHQRAKLGLSHIALANLHAMVRRAVRVINQERIVLRYAHADLDVWKAAFSDGEIQVQHETDGSTTSEPFHIEAKGLLGMVAQASLIVPEDGSKGPPASACEIFASKDPTMTRFMGKNRRQAHNWNSGFSDIGAPAGHVYKLEPHVVDGNEASCLQLADIAAYMVAHAVIAPGFFRAQLATVRFWTNSVLDPTMS